MTGTQSQKPTESRQPAGNPEDLRCYAQTPVDAVLQRHRTSLEGLTEAEAEVRLTQFGLNEVAKGKHHSWWLRLLKTFNSPFNYLLMGLEIISYFSGNHPSALMIGVMVLLSGLLRFIQETRSSRAAEKLQELVTNRVSVRRRPSETVPGQRQEISLKNLVPGDIITLASGDLIPADVRVIEARDLHINQSALSGESFPVEKNAAPDMDTEKT